ncbi:polynucleotide 5'-hydroxyl-kinase NOL9 [Leptinotarsa decemlineata]|uniref:polynucleotide 5'-hydroxyl-kinase NOL9 n=1 Tax=Leptinotarsa decemlineata TaxID=7539 RepID=UPI003D309F43
MPKTPKKIRFALDDYKSETVFTKLSSTKKDKSKKKKKSVRIDEDYEPSSNITKESRTLTPYKSRSSKKRKLVVSYSNESFQEDSAHFISPSKSELPEIISDGEESSNSFDFDDFFFSRDHSLNDSITEAHSGIDYELISEGMRKANICRKQVSVSSENISNVKQVRNAAEDKKIVSNINVSVQVDVNELNNRLNELNNRCIEEPILDNPPNEYEQIKNTLVEEAILSNSNVNNTSEGTRKKGSRKKVAQYYKMKDEQIVLLKKNCSLPFFGLFTLKVIHGSIEVLGCVRNKHSKEINLYSPRGSALLVIKNVTEKDEECIPPMFSNLNVLNGLKDFVDSECVAIFKYSELDEDWLRCTENHIAQQIFPRFDDNRPRVEFEPEDDWNVVSESPSWDVVLSNVDTSTKLLVTGGKGVGKSTFIKYSINRLLNRYDRIRVIDLDPGQSEFTVPGSISVLTVTEPICGPNYTHLRRPDRSYLSSITVDDLPNYFKTIKLLLEELDTKQNIPTLINYMGFTQGVGLKIVSSAIAYIVPTDVVQISSQSSKKNFKEKLSPNTARKYCCFFEGDPSNINFKLHELPSMNDNNTGWTVGSRQAREMCVLSYVGRMMTRGVNSLTRCENSMNEIGLDSIKIVDEEGSEMCPAAVNTNLVALCSMDTTSKIFRCMGYGIVRGIDLTSNNLVLMTPEAKEVLEEVYYLVTNSVYLPPSVYMSPDEITGNIPFVQEAELEYLAQITKRSYIPVNKK